MSDSQVPSGPQLYKIAIRCDHGDKKPRIAYALHNGTRWWVEWSAAQAKSKSRSGRSKIDIDPDGSEGIQDGPHAHLVGAGLNARLASEVTKALWAWPDNDEDFGPEDAARMREVSAVVESASWYRPGLWCSVCNKKVVGIVLIEMFETARRAGQHTIVI